MNVKTLFLNNKAMEVVGVLDMRSTISDVEKVYELFDKGVDEAMRSWVKIKLETTDQTGDVILAGDATVLLPSKERGGVIYPAPDYFMGKF